MSTLPGFRASFSHHRHSAMSLRTHCIRMNRSRAQTPAPGRHLAMHTLQESGKRSWTRLTEHDPRVKIAPAAPNLAGAH